MDFYKLLSKLDQIEKSSTKMETYTKNENCMQGECGGNMPPVPPIPTQPPIQPPSMNVNLNAQGMDDIEQMMQLFQKVNPDMVPKSSVASPISDKSPPTTNVTALKMLPLDMDMDELPGKSMKPHTHLDSDDEMGSDDEPYDIDADEEEENHESTDFSSSTTNPDERYYSSDYMNNKLAGGMNSPKDTYPRVAGGDNPMQRVREAEDAAEMFKQRVREELKQRLAEAKKKPTYGSSKDKTRG